MPRSTLESKVSTTALMLMTFFLPAVLSSSQVEEALTLIHDIATENMGTLCSVEKFRSLPAPLPSITKLHEITRQKADMAINLIRDVGISRGSQGLLDAVARNLVDISSHVLAARVMSLNSSTGVLIAFSEWPRERITSSNASPRTERTGSIRVGKRPGIQPWFPSEMHTPRFMDPLPEQESNPVGKWTYPYYACWLRKWMMSYSARIPNSGLEGVLSLDVDLSSLEINQCDTVSDGQYSMPAEFHGTHKCHITSECESVPGRGWKRGAYRCHCRHGFYARKPLLPVFNGSLVENAWVDQLSNASTVYTEMYRCRACAPGCARCDDSQPCLADYNWPFRIALLTVTCICVLFTLALICYVAKHHKLKVFKVASPIFLSITLLGCAIMYLEMAAIFPVLDTYSCVATKWTRHLGFCVTYTALLMKTWRVSLTYRVKSAHKIKLTDKQLLQWMFPILLIMLIYLGTWTLSSPPHAEDIRDRAGLRFKQCTYNWWDHSLAIGEVLFLAWGIRVCYSVRHAESLYNEARLISYAIYNIAVVNIAMVAFHLFIFPRAGPDIKYLLGFIRTQLSTSVTVVLVFGPKVYRVLRGHGDQYDSRARARGVTASFSLNGIGLVTEEPPDLYQENEELKEEIQKLAAQIEFMRIVHMEMNNRHLKPKPGGYFSGSVPGTKVFSSRSEVTSDAGPSGEPNTSTADRL